MIAILDYGSGNLKSVEKACEFLHHDVVVTNDSGIAKEADKIILPGVGAFGDAMDGLKKSGLDKVVYDAVEKGTPTIGICIGMQLMFESSEESHGVAGLGIFKGKVKRIPDCGLKIPQMGWNSLNFKDDPLFKGLMQGDFVYFVHSYYPSPDDEFDSIAKVHYGENIDVACHRGNVFATQFHPEKSGSVGLRILDNFAKLQPKEKYNDNISGN